MLKETTEQRIFRICRGDREAVEFLCLWARYCHAIDDLVDEDVKGPEKLLSAFAQSPVLFSHPFYLRNMFALRAVVLLVTNMYADSVAWERSSLPWRREFANCYRHCGNEMLIAVAQICGGFDHAQTISLEQRELCYNTQHPEPKEKIA